MAFEVHRNPVRFPSVRVPFLATSTLPHAAKRARSSGLDEPGESPAPVQGNAEPTPGTPGARGYRPHDAGGTGGRRICLCGGYTPPRGGLLRKGEGVPLGSPRTRKHRRGSGRNKGTGVKGVGILRERVIHNRADGTETGGLCCKAQGDYPYKGSVAASTASCDDSTYPASWVRESPLPKDLRRKVMV